MQALRLLKKFFWCSRNQSLSLLRGTTKESSTWIQLAPHKVSCQPTAANPLSPAKGFVHASPPQDSPLAFRHECESQVPAQRFERLRMLERDADQPTPCPVCPTYQPTPKRDTKQIKVKLPDGTYFQMSTFGQRNNKEPLSSSLRSSIS